MSLVLYVDSFYESPYVLSAFVALEEKGVPYETRTVAFHTGDLKKPDYPAHTGRVPCLVHDGFVLAESSAIAEYVDEAFEGPPLLPKGLKERALAREVMAWIRSDLLPIREQRPSTTVFLPFRADKPLDGAGEAAKARLLKGVEQLVKPGQTTLFGVFCVADADLAMMLMRLVRNGDAVPAHLEAYARAVWARPSVQKFVRMERPTPYVPH